MLFLPGRKVVTRSPHRRVGYVSCPWFQDTQIQYESLLELSFVRNALLCPMVQAIEAQPFKIELDGGALYTPDFLLSCEGLERIVVEVKPTVFISKHRDKLNQAKGVLEAHGYTFLVCSDDEIHADKRHERASLILRYARSQEVLNAVDCLCIGAERQPYPSSVDALSLRWGLSFHQVMSLIGRRELFLRSDLSLDCVFSPEAYKESSYGPLSPSSWLGYTDW